MPGRHSDVAEDPSEDRPAHRKKAALSVLAILVLAAVGVTLYLTLPGSGNGAATPKAAVAASPTIGANGECLGEYLAVPKTSWAHEGSPKGASTTRVDLDLVNHGVSCKLVYPTRAILTAPNGSTSTVSMTAPSTSSTIDAGAHLSLRISSSYPASTCADVTRPNSITLEFGGQKLQVALPADFRTAAWAHGCAATVTKTVIGGVA